MIKTLLAGTSALAFSLLIATPAAAQDTAPAPERQDTGAAPEGDIVVTALRRQSTLQTAPLSIAAITGDTLAKTGATQLTDYFRQVPNLNVTASQGGANRISIRGVNASGEATVGLYYDETPVTGPSGTTQDAGWVAADLNLFDVERLEVLRGPQGTLYGASSMAGTLRVIFNKPNYTDVGFASEAQVTSTEHGSMGYFAKGMVNLPVVTDKLAVRAVGYYEKRPGWIDNVRYGRSNVNDQENWGLRGLIGFKPDEDTTITGTVIYQRSNADDQQGWYPAVGLYKTDSPARLPFNSKMQLYNIKGERDLGFATLTATASWYRYDFLRALDFSASTAALAQSPAGCRAYFRLAGACTPAQLATFRNNGFALLPAIGYQPAYVRSQTNELRLTSGDSMPAWLEWTVGGYLEKRSDHIDSQTVQGDPASGDVYQPLRLLSNRYVETRLRQIAGFGEVSLKPVEGLTLTGGLRYYDYRRTVRGESYLTNVYTGALQTPFSSVTVEANGWIEKFNVSYRINPRVMVYASASKGFRPGGANNVPGLPTSLVAYKADSLWNYEAGLKSSWLGNALVFNAAVFDVEWKDIQSSARTADGLFGFLTNAGKARITGGEVDISVRPIGGLTLNAAAGYSNARLVEDQSNAAVLVTASTGLKGDPIPNTPKWTASGSAEYRHSVGGDLTALARADLAYTGKMQSTFRNTDPYFTKYGGYTTVNARVGVEGENWGAYLFCQNLFDKVGNVGVSNGFGYTGLTYSIMPRTIGINARFGL